MSGPIFREYDIRGDAEQDLDDAFTRRLGQALAVALRPKGGAAPRVVVARDCRRSGPRLFEALLSGLVAGGVDVIDIGVGPTPMLYFGVHHFQADGGVMITASHNPPEDNGFKIMKGRDDFFGEDLRALRQAMLTPEPPPTQAMGSIQTIPVDDVYIEELVKRVNVTDTTLPFVVDGGNGSAGPMGLKAMRAAGLKPHALFCEMDSRFPNHHPNPAVEANLGQLRQQMLRIGARLGIAWDGDGDRLGVLDADGSVIWGDRLLTLFARTVLAEHPGAAIVGDVKCSQLCFDDVARLGGRPIMWKTGHSLIKAHMREEHALLGGEMSGHFFFADRHFGYDDAIYAALRLLEIVGRAGKTISQLLSDLPRSFASPEVRLECPEALKFEVVRRAGTLLQVGAATLSTLDGVRLTYPDGSWGLLRASNTGPLVSLRAEAPSEARLVSVQQQLESALSRARAEVERP